MHDLRTLDIRKIFKEKLLNPIETISFCQTFLKDIALLSRYFHMQQITSMLQL